MTAQRDETPKLIQRKRLIRVTFECFIPGDVTFEEIDNWVGFDLGENGRILEAVLEKFNDSEITEWDWKEL